MKVPLAAAGMNTKEHMHPCPGIKAHYHTKAQVLLFIQLKLFFNKSFMSADSRVHLLTELCTGKRGGGQLSSPEGLDLSRVMQSTLLVDSSQSHSLQAFADVSIAPNMGQLLRPVKPCSRALRLSIEVKSAITLA